MRCQITCPRLYSILGSGRANLGTQTVWLQSSFQGQKLGVECLEAHAQRTRDDLGQTPAQSSPMQAFCSGRLQAPKWDSAPGFKWASSCG